MYICQAEYPSAGSFPGTTVSLSRYITDFDMRVVISAEDIKITATIVLDKIAEISMIHVKYVGETDYSTVQEHVIQENDQLYTIVSTLTISGLTNEQIIEVTAGIQDDYSYLLSPYIDVRLSQGAMTGDAVEDGASTQLFCVYRATDDDYYPIESTKLYRQVGDIGDETWEEIVGVSGRVLDGDEKENIKDDILDDGSKVTFISEYVGVMGQQLFAGQYKCIFKVNDIIEIESKPNSLHLLSVSIPVQSMLVEMGKAAMITCSFTGPSIPSFTVTWNSDMSDNSNSWNPVYVSLLYLSSSSVKEDGVENIVTTYVFSKITERYFDFRVEAEFQIFGTQATRSLETLFSVYTASLDVGFPIVSLYFDESTNFMFYCKYQFDKAADVLISPTHTSSVTQDDNTQYCGSPLTCGYYYLRYPTPPTESPSGPYECKVKIQASDGYVLSFSKQVTLNILSVPPDLLDVEIKTVQSGEYFRLMCCVSNDTPRFTLGWFVEDNTGNGAEDRAVASNRYDVVAYQLSRPDQFFH